MEERIKKFLLSQQYKNPELLYKWFSQNRLYINFLNGYCTDAPMSYNSFKIFMQLCKSAETIYENNWDILITPVKTDTGRIIFLIKGIVIHFEEVEIKNNLGDSHTIRDLFIAVLIRQDKYNSIEVQIAGERFTLTEQELSSGYRHSHLNPGGSNKKDFLEKYKDKVFSLENIYNFCLGDSIISDIRYNIPRQNNLVSNCDNLLLLLNTLAGWESLDGGPYIKFSQIYFSRRSSFFRGTHYIHPEDSITNKLYELFVDSVHSNKEFNNLGFYSSPDASNNQIVIKLRDVDWIKNKLNILCIENIENLLNLGQSVEDFKKDYFMYKDTSTLTQYAWFVKPNLEEFKKDEHLIEESSYECIFNGKTIKRKVLIKNDIEQEHKEVLKRLREELNSYIITNIINKLEDEFNKKVITKARNKKYLS